MVEYSLKLNAIFGSLSDPTRRDILKRLNKKTMSIGEIAEPYNQSFAGIAKHLQVLQKAHLISKQRKGKEQIVALVPAGLSAADKYLKNFEKIWIQRLNRLDIFLESNK